MKRLFSVAIFVIASLAIIAGMILRNLDAEPQPVQAQGVLVAQPTASPHPTATASPMPTVDYQQVWPAQTQAAAAYELAQAQERIARAAATMARATEQAYQSALIAGTPTAQALETQRAEATAQAQADVQAAYIQQERAKIMAAIETDEHAKRTDENIRLILYALGAGVVFVLVVTVIRMLDYRAKTALFVAATGAATSNPLEHIAPVTDAPAGYQPVVQVNVSRREVHQFDVQITSAEKAVLRRAAVELRGRFSRPTMTPKYFTDPRWREIDDVLCEIREGGVSLAMRKPNQPTYLTPEGWQWLGLMPPTHPLNDKSPETNENTAILQPTQPNQPTEQAGGVGWGEHGKDEG